jgi:P-type conjugative transfer protein TrbJ
LDKIKDQLSDLKNVQDQFQATFPGYDKYAEEKDPEKEKDYLERYKNMVDSTQKALTNVTNEMASLNDPSRIQAEQAALNGIKQDISGAEGTKAAVQGLAELDSQIISQIQMLRQQMAAQSAAQNTYYAAQVQRDADIRTEVSKMIGNGDQKIENYLDNNPLDLPSFDS